MDISDYNRRWLAAWSAKDTAALLGFYGPNVTYKDAQVPQGLTGHAPLKVYLDGLFAATPPMEYVADETWPIPGGFCGRWNCKFTAPDGSKHHLRGFDLVLLDGETITHNEVYTHAVPV